MKAATKKAQRNAVSEIDPGIKFDFCHKGQIHTNLRFEGGKECLIHCGQEMATKNDIRE